MPITQTQVLPAQFIQDVGQDYATQLAAATAAPLPTAQFAPAVAGQTALQQQATTLAGQIAPGGIAAYEPYLTGAAQAGVRYSIIDPSSYISNNIISVTTNKW